MLPVFFHCVPDKGRLMLTVPVQYAAKKQRNRLSGHHVLLKQGSVRVVLPDVETMPTGSDQLLSQGFRQTFHCATTYKGSTIFYYSPRLTKSLQPDLRYQLDLRICCHVSCAVLPPYDSNFDDTLIRKYQRTITTTNGINICKNYFKSLKIITFFSGSKNG